MKCAATKVRQTDKSAEQCRIYGENFLDWVEIAFSYELANTYAWFRSAPNLQAFYDGTRDEMVGRVELYMPDSFRIRDRRHGDRMAEEWEAQKDGIVTARFSVERQLRDLGFPDTDWRQMEPEPDDGWQSPEEAKRAGWRKTYWQEYGHNAMLLWTGCNLLWVLSSTYSTGKERFSTATVTDRIYMPFAAKVRRYEGRFLSGRAAADRRNRAECDVMQRWFREQLHIDIGDLGDGTKKRPEIGEQKKSEVDPRFAQILEDMKRRGFGKAY